MDAKTQSIIDILSGLYPNPKSELDFKNPYELIVAVILSAQCTDKRVNQVTPALFKKAPTPVDLANMPTEELEQIIFSCGFYKNKAKHLKLMAQALVERFDGQVPNNLEDLRSLPTAQITSELLKVKGIGKKVADCITLFGYSKTDSFPVDTWIEKIYSQNLNGTQKDRVKISNELLEKFGDLSGYIQQYVFYYKRSLENKE